MDIIDPAALDTWPPDIRVEVEQLAARCRDQPVNTPETPSYELQLEQSGAAEEADGVFRNLLGQRQIALFHATRLLPHELASVRTDGLLVLSDEHRSSRLAKVIEIYGTQLGVESLERLRTAGPLSWNRTHRTARLGKVHGVTPLRIAFEDGGDGLTVFLDNWGGESFYWAATESDELKVTLQHLTTLSTPAIVEIGIYAHTLNWYTNLWPVFVGQLDGWPEPWHEFSITQSIPPDQIVAILGPSSDRWPVAPPRHDPSSLPEG
jgi:hypothetical protein